MSRTSLTAPPAAPTGARDRAVAGAGWLTAALAGTGVGLQLALNVTGNEHGLGPLGETLHLLSFFTITSNLLVAVMSVLAARDPARTGRWFDALRLAALVMISVTGVVYWVLLHGDVFTGLDWWVNVLTHAVVPLCAVGSWLIVGPRGRFHWGLVPLMMVVPGAWLVHALVRGAASGYYAYTFMDPTHLGYLSVGVNLAGVAAFALLLAAAFVGIDSLRRPTPSPEPPDSSL